jgi:hypothetical protein
MNKNIFVHELRGGIGYMIDQIKAASSQGAPQTLQLYSIIPRVK